MRVAMGNRPIEGLMLALDGEDTGSPPAPISAASPGLYQTLLDSMNEGVSLSNEEGTIIYANPAADRLFGYEPGELIGKNVSAQNAHSSSENVRRVGAVAAELKANGA